MLSCYLSNILPNKIEGSPAKYPRDGILIANTIFSHPSGARADSGWMSCGIFCLTPPIRSGLASGPPPNRPRSAYRVTRPLLSCFKKEVVFLRYLVINSFTFTYISTDLLNVSLLCKKSAVFVRFGQACFSYFWFFTSPNYLFYLCLSVC